MRAAEVARAHGLRDARQLFKAAREAAADTHRRSRILREMEYSECARAPRMDAGRGQGSRDGMERTDARLDLESKWAPVFESNGEIMDAATEVLYGADWMHGLAVLTGQRDADILYFRYLSYESWDRVAQLMGISSHHALRLHNIALDFIDANGIQETADGIRTI